MVSVEGSGTEATFTVKEPLLSPRLISFTARKRKEAPTGAVMIPDAPMNTKPVGKSASDDGEVVVAKPAISPA